MSKSQRALKLFLKDKLTPVGLARAIRNAQRTDPNAAQGVTYNRRRFVPDQLERGQLAIELARQQSERAAANNDPTVRGAARDVPGGEA